MEKYDVVVIGAGPGGEKAAVKAAYFKLRVAIVEKSLWLGGAAAYEAIPSKVLKETALYLSGKLEETVYGISLKDRREISIELFMRRAQELSAQHALDVRENFKQHGVDVYQGEAYFDDPHQIHITGQRERVIYGEHIIIATGTEALVCGSGSVVIDGKRIHNSRTILDVARIPRSLCIVGMGVSGCEYGSIFSVLGTKIIFINNSRNVLPLFDGETIHCFLEELQGRGGELIFNGEIVGIKIPESDEKDLSIELKSEEILHVDMILYAAGRSGNTKDLKLENAGVSVDQRGRIPCNEQYQTNVPHIYAVGDVNGLIPLANVAMDQGRAAVAHILKEDPSERNLAAVPYGMYSVPEVARVGVKEEDLKALQIEYGVGYGYYSDISRGKLVGSKGFMKIIFSKDDSVIKGIHIVGPLATELIHYGADLIVGRRTLQFAANQLFNFPTLHELYKYAAYDGLSFLKGYKMKKRSQY